MPAPKRKESFFSLSCTQHNVLGSTFFNLRSDITITIAELAQLLLKFSGKQAHVEFDSSYMSYEMFRIKNFDLTMPFYYGWKPKV